ncbi:16837_t:CDS:10 [Entrophospora sp. SA101]|nr:16837_t:CDS:10 [Entrophospora sp. SA101]
MQKCIITCNRLYRSKQIIIISSLFQNLFPSPRSPNLITRSIQQASSKTISNADDELDPRFINSKFPCLRPTPLEPHYNKSLIEALKVIRKSRELSGNVKSESSYRDAIAALKSYPRDIKSGKEAIKIACIGDKIRHHIQTFLETDNIPEVEETLKDPKFQTLCLFTQVYGVGSKKANEWYNKGYRTIDDYIEEIIEILDKEIKEIDPLYLLIPVGGYRRGKEINGDLDLLVSYPEGNMDPHSLNKIMSKLDDKGLCFFAFWQQSKNIYRQVDIVIAPKSDYSTALLGWTGSAVFEKSFREYTKKVKKMRITSHGLFTDTSPRQRINVSNEKEIFEILESNQQFIAKLKQQLKHLNENKENVPK